MKKFILGLVFILLITISASAQSPSPTPSDSDVDLMQRAQMVAEITKLRAENVGLKNQVSVQKDQIVDLHKLNDVQELRITDLKDANSNLHTAVEISPKIESLYEKQLNDYRTENQRLRDENAKLRKSRDKSNLIFGIIGAVAGHFLF